MNAMQVQQFQVLWEQFTWSMLALGALWAVCGVVLLLHRPFANRLAILLLLCALALLTMAPIAPASWGVLITAFVVHAYGRLSRLYHPCLTRAGALVSAHKHGPPPSSSQTDLR